jgi:hypothetical protein
MEMNIPIQLDSVCSTQGTFTPRWFRFEDEENQIQTVKIQRIVSEKELNYVGVRVLQYICAAAFKDEEKIFELRYYVGSHKWTFFKMLT